LFCRVPTGFHMFILVVRGHITPSSCSLYKVGAYIQRTVQLEIYRCETFYRQDFVHVSYCNKPIVDFIIITKCVGNIVLPTIITVPKFCDVIVGIFCVPNLGMSGILSIIFTLYTYRVHTLSLKLNNIVFIRHEWIPISV